MTIATLCLILALILFVLAAVGVTSRFNLTAAGLAFMVLAMLVGGASLG
jgi:hypothetical protein